MLRAFTAISNKGIMLEPQFIKQVADVNQGTVRTAKKKLSASQFLSRPPLKLVII